MCPSNSLLVLLHIPKHQRRPVNHDHDSFPANHADVTFVGRPFPLEEAPDHLARLRRWGLTFGKLILFTVALLVSNMPLQCASSSPGRPWNTPARELVCYIALELHVTYRPAARCMTQNI